MAIASQGLLASQMQRRCFLLNFPFRRMRKKENTSARQGRLTSSPVLLGAKSDRSDRARLDFRTRPDVVYERDLAHSDEDDLRSIRLTLRTRRWPFSFRMFVVKRRIWRRYGRRKRDAREEAIYRRGYSA